MAGIGVGFGDILLLVKLTKTTIANCRSAPSHFAQASRVCQSLQLMLEGIKIEYDKAESSLHRVERTRTDFAIHFKNCERALQFLADYIAKFATLGGPKIKLIDRFRISPKDILELRGNLAYFTARLSDFLAQVGLRTLGRVETKIDDIGEYLPQIMDRIDQMFAEVRILGDKESLLSEHTDDEKSVWKTFRSKLISSGCTSNMLREHEAAIFLRFRELKDCGMLESDVSSRGSTISDVPESSQPVFYFSDKESESGYLVHSEDDDSAVESEMTITPKPSVRSLRAERSKQAERKKDIGSVGPSIASSKANNKRNELDENCYVSGQRSPTADASANAPRQSGRSKRPETRIWRSSTGSTIGKASLTTMESGFAILHDLEGQEIKVAYSGLSMVDQEYVDSSQMTINTEKSQKSSPPTWRS